MRCKLCREKAVYLPLGFCKEHFLAYHGKRVRKYLESTGTRNTRILIGVSGGKDSSALADALSLLAEEFGLELGLFTIDLRIPGYSERGLAVVKELSRKYGIPLIIEDLEEMPKRIPDFAGTGGKPCSQCGVIKRYLLNKAAVERGYDYVATGHNLDDEFFFAMHNLLHRNVEQLRRQGKKLPPRPEQKLAGRVKPLYYLTEKENRLYCLLRGVPHDADECPYSVDNPQVRFKEEFAGITREQKKNLLKSVAKLREGDGSQDGTQPGAAGKEGAETEEDGSVHPCPSCGYPTTSGGECVYCRLMLG